VDTFVLIKFTSVLSARMIPVLDIGEYRLVQTSLKVEPMLRFVIL
jgi:hypothetical protein